MVAKIGMAPNVAAEKILRAVKEKMKVLVGKDAVIMDAMKGLHRTDTWIICQNSKETIC